MSKVIATQTWKAIKHNGIVVFLSANSLEDAQEKFQSRFGYFPEPGQLVPQPE